MIKSIKVFKSEARSTKSQTNSKNRNSPPKADQPLAEKIKNWELKIMLSKKRCPWVPEGDALYAKYHDTEWGVPVHDDRTHFEFLVLEAAQAGLSWRTVLGKREEYRKQFKNFNPKLVAKFGAADVARMLRNKGLIRNRLKLSSAINNARHFLKIQKEFGSFDQYVWKFVGGKPLKHRIVSAKDYPVTTKEAITLSNDLKKRGFTFVGPTVIYAHMQATGLASDHVVGCWRRGK